MQCQSCKFKACIKSQIMLNTSSPQCNIKPRVFRCFWSKNMLIFTPTNKLNYNKRLLWVVFCKNIFCPDQQGIVLKILRSSETEYQCFSVKKEFIKIISNGGYYFELKRYFEVQFAKILTIQQNSDDKFLIKNKISATPSPKKEKPLVIVNIVNKTPLILS